MSRQLRLAVVQTPGAPAPGHLDRVGASVVDAARQGAELLLLPELFSSPFRFDADVWRWATPRGGQVERFLQALARESRVYLGGSYLEVRGDDFFNTFALASPAGEIVGRVGKAHPCSLERCVFAPAPGPRVIVTELGRIGVAICYDNSLRGEVDGLLAEHPDLWLMPMSAPLPPSSLAGRAGVEAYRVLLRDSPAAMAGHFGIPFAMANKAGPWVAPIPGWLPTARSSFPGYSQIVDGDGGLLALLGDEPGLAVADVRCDPARKRLKVPADLDRHRPWLGPVTADFRLFPFFEWWGRRRYRHHPERVTIARDRSECHD